MPHAFEPAPTGRAKCRGCAQAIAKGSVRFGECVPNPFAEGDTMLWFHPLCAAYKRPESLLAALPAAPADLAERAALEAAATLAASHRRLPRIDGAERAPTGQAKCRHCHAPIAKGEWRIRLAFFEDVRFTPGGFIHLGCRREYFEIGDVLAPVLHFSPELDDAARAEVRAAWA